MNDTKSELAEERDSHDTFERLRSATPRLARDHGALVLLASVTWTPDVGVWRLASLSRPCRRLLALAAVVGREFFSWFEFPTFDQPPFNANDALIWHCCDGAVVLSAWRS